MWAAGLGLLGVGLSSSRHGVLGLIDLPFWGRTHSCHPPMAVMRLERAAQWLARVVWGAHLTTPGRLRLAAWGVTAMLRCADENCATDCGSSTAVHLVNCGWRMGCVGLSTTIHWSCDSVTGGDATMGPARQVSGPSPPRASGDLCESLRCQRTVPRHLPHACPYHWNSHAVRWGRHIRHSAHRGVGLDTRDSHVIAHRAGSLTCPFGVQSRSELTGWVDGRRGPRTGGIDGWHLTGAVVGRGM